MAKTPTNMAKSVKDRLLNIARHDPVKGLDILLRAMTLLPESVRSARLSVR